MRLPCSSCGNRKRQTTCPMRLLRLHQALPLLVPHLDSLGLRSTVWCDQPKKCSSREGRLNKPGAEGGGCVPQRGLRGNAWISRAEPLHPPVFGCCWQILRMVSPLIWRWIFVLTGAGIQEIQNQSVRSTWRLNLIGLPSDRNDVLCCEDASEGVLRQNGNECGPKE